MRRSRMRCQQFLSRWRVRISCAGIIGRLGETCVDDLCQRVICYGANCPGGQFCGDRACTGSECPESGRDERMVCLGGLCVEDLCDGVVCPRKERCEFKESSFL